MSSKNGISFLLIIGVLVSASTPALYPNSSIAQEKESTKIVKHTRKYEASKVPAQSEFMPMFGNANAAATFRNGHSHPNSSLQYPIGLPPPQ